MADAASEAKALCADSPFAKFWKVWEKLASVLAVIGLADLFGQTIKWAAAISWLVAQYGLVKDWLFTWLPFRVPAEWRDFLFLVAILFSVTNIGYYRRTGHAYVSDLLKVAASLVAMAMLLPLAALNTRARERREDLRRSVDLSRLRDHGTFAATLAVMVLSALAQLVASVEGLPTSLDVILGAERNPLHNVQLSVSLPVHLYAWANVAWIFAISGGLIAWRWICGTLLVFASMVAINEVYVRWLEPLAR